MSSSGGNLAYVQHMGDCSADEQTEVRHSSAEPFEEGRDEDGHKRTA